MHFLKIFLLVLTIAMFAACNSNNSDSTTKEENSSVDTKTTASLVFPYGSSVTLTQNSQAYTVDILVLGPDNVPLDSGTVKIAYPDKVKEGIDVGYFSSNSVDIKNGHAKFNYVGPQNLQERVDAGDTSTQFKFYLSDDPDNYVTFTIYYQPESDQIVLASYNLGWNKTASETSIGLESSTQLSFYIENDKQERINDSYVISLKVTVLNPIATLKDTYGNSGYSLSFSGKNNVSLMFNSSTISGIVPIQVDATFKDANDQEQNLSKVFNMTIFSGPPTAISISYAGTDFDKDKTKFVEKMIVTVTDKYFNKVNTQPAISAALIAGYTKDAAQDRRLFFTPGGDSNATLDPNTDTLSVNGGVNLSNVDKDTDIVATFGNGYTYEASGKWDIASLDGTSTINLISDFNASAPISGLGYAIGHNYRQDTCREGEEWVGYVVINNQEGNILTKDGYVEVDIYYDYYLTGKKVVLAVNILGKDVHSNTMQRLGEAKAWTLRSTGFEDYTADIPSGATNYTVDLPVLISNTGEWLRNARFGYKLTTSDNITLNSSTLIDNVGGCQNGGIAYVRVNVTNTTADQVGTITLHDILIADEF